ncbi:MAG: nicotinate (nicotinamide) nucleotide adenylyltransferase [Shewanella sp.]|nr:nicotinate (nicotinamide) nucleotide adenylyltransferase [Shewanella sp.]MCF1429844.1 nicotinate (nicotinamide) nucleotide adenylyltransferase [Shewanella sp.]MCF1437771.1 nicotinate (nicotinamide) nucleotide adenylyltransferase [Shewanella sp.]MCF1458194.1 nicotinate (nicotinamide) nucleotide adenylyltransferase [Shewanella sp.]
MTKVTKRQWIGLLGGTFDPIHFGHIKPALEVKQQLGLDEVWLMPNAIPPHKADSVTEAKHRLAMVQAVCDATPDLKLCEIELQLAADGTPSYSVNTLTALTQGFPHCDFVFLMGMDSLQNLPSWHAWQQLLTLCQFAVCTRPGWQPDRSLLPTLINQLIVPQLIRGVAGQIQLMDVTPQPCSSTEIRQALNAGNLPTGMLPKEVLDYIRLQRLYQASLRKSK